MLPQADGRPPQITICEVVILAVRTKQIDAAEIARIVSHDHLRLVAYPRAQDVGPVADRMQENAFPANQPTGERQEVDEETAGGCNRRGFPRAGGYFSAFHP